MTPPSPLALTALLILLVAPLASGYYYSPSAYYSYYNSRSPYYTNYYANYYSSPRYYSSYGSSSNGYRGYGSGSYNNVYGYSSPYYNYYNYGGQYTSYCAQYPQSCYGGGSNYNYNNYYSGNYYNSGGSGYTPGLGAYGVSGYSGFELNRGINPYSGSPWAGNIGWGNNLAAFYLVCHTCGRAG